MAIRFQILGMINCKYRCEKSKTNNTFCPKKQSRVASTGQINLFKNYLFYLTGFLSKARDPSLTYYLPIAWDRIDKFFLKVINAKWNKLPGSDLNLVHQSSFPQDALLPW